MGDRLVKLTLSLVLVVAACGGGDDVAEDLDDIFEDAVQQAQNDDNDGGDDGGSAGSGGAGSATVSINGGPTYELTISDACVLLDIGVGVVAEGPDGKLEIAGLPDASNVAFTMGDDLYLAAAAPIVVDGDTVTYVGPVGGPNVRHRRDRRLQSSVRRFVASPADPVEPCGRST